MSTKEDILNKFRRNKPNNLSFDMPDFTELKPVVYADIEKQFIDISNAAGAEVVIHKDGDDLNEILRSLYPEAKVFASNLPEITIAHLNPDTVEMAQSLNGTDVGIVRGTVGVAENGCIWIPQTMKERAVCFISEYLVILLDRKALVSNMHEAYERVEKSGFGCYGGFISGASKTADIAQALVMGAQAARGVKVILT